MLPNAPPTDPRWARLAKIAALVVGQGSRSLTSLVPKNERQAAICQLLRQNLVDLIATPQLLSPPERALCGKFLSQLGDPRPGVGLRADGLPDLLWCDVPTGEFIYEKKQQLTLPAFKITKYPITYRQFQVFYDAADGYFNPMWWHDLPESLVKNIQRMEQLKIERDTFLNNLPAGERAKYQVEIDYQAHKCWNHPRVDVDWYEAIAFCRWMSAKLGYEVCLPTQQEWQKAARGTDGRLYPYGNEFDPTKGNTSETGIRGTSAVGLFPDGASPYGVLDMSGNVWEWMLNDFDGLIEHDIAKIASPMLCGGAYSESKTEAQVTSQANNPPQKSANFGFRVLCP